MKTAPALVLAAALFTLAGCASSHNGVQDSYGTNAASAKHCSTCAAHGVGSKEGMAWFKNLSTGNGRWVSHNKGPDGKDHETVLVFKTVSNGSAVCETLFPGTAEEMITMYHLDGDRLVGTHYCAMGNQPRMVATVCACDTANKTCKFNFLDGTNMDASKDSFMGKQGYTFCGPDTLAVKWHHLGPGGKDSPETFDVTFTRVK